MDLNKFPLSLKIADYCEKISPTQGKNHRLLIEIADFDKKVNFSSDSPTIAKKYRRLVEKITDF
jgi:hypothetical protein